MLRRPEAHELVRISRNSVAKEKHAGRFPRHHQLTDYALGWRPPESQAWAAGERNWPRREPPTP